MDKYTIAEEAYKNGYAKGYEDGKTEAVHYVNPEPNMITLLDSHDIPVCSYRNGFRCPICKDSGIKQFCPTCGAKAVWGI